jgi:hypothetical protein
MSVGEDDLAGRIIRRLDRSLDDIDPPLLAGLRSARTAALERMQPEAESLLAWAGAFSGVALWRYANPRYFVPIVGMVLTVSAMAWWQQQQRIEDPVEIDAKLLASELPIDALLDKGLDTWLER